MPPMDSYHLKIASLSLSKYLGTHKSVKVMGITPTGSLQRLRSPQMIWVHCHIRSCEHFKLLLMIFGGL